VAIVIPAIAAILIACATPKTLARSNKGKLPSSSNSALAKTPSKARIPQLVKGA
jgi:hypothetical protein